MWEEKSEASMGQVHAMTSSHAVNGKVVVWVTAEVLTC